MGEIISFVSGKGGAGKSICSAFTASALALRGKKTLLVDACAGLRCLDIILGLDTQVINTWQDLLRGTYPPEDCIITHPAYSLLDFLPAPQTCLPSGTDPAGWEAMIHSAAASYDFVLIDSPPGLETGFRHAVGPADRVILVCTGDKMSVRAADRVRADLQSCGMKDISLIVNRIRPKWLARKQAVSPDEISDLLGCPLVGAVPESGRAARAADSGEAFLLTTDNSAASSFRDIAGRICGENIPFSISSSDKKKSRK